MRSPLAHALVPLLALALPGGARGAEWALAGQHATCADGPRTRTFTLRASEGVRELGMGLRVDGMTLGSPGQPIPVLEACEGDTVTLGLENTGSMAHGIDSHAFRIDTGRFGPVNQGGKLSYRGVMTTPGAFMFHCASGPVTDVHIKSGMYGEMIVYPRRPFRPAHEIAVVQGGLFGEPDENGLVHIDSGRIARNDPYTMMFDGRLEHETVKVTPGQLVRVYFVNAGPGSSAIHVMGTLLDRFYASGNPRNVEYGVQTGLVPAGGGAVFEFRVPEKGMYMLVDHDNLRFLPFGFGIGFMAD